jgi:hypothetical protein
MKHLALPMTLILLTGCVSTFWKEGRSPVVMPNGTTNTQYTVHVSQKAFLTKSDLSNLKVPYHGEYISLGSYNTAGDVAMMESISKCVVYGLAAYSSLGSVPAMEAILAALKSGEVDRVVGRIRGGGKVTVDDFPVARAFATPGPALLQTKPRVEAKPVPIMLLSSP